MMGHIAVHYDVPVSFVGQKSRAKEGENAPSKLQLQQSLQIPQQRPALLVPRELLHAALGAQALGALQGNDPLLDALPFMTNLETLKAGSGQSGGSGPWPGKKRASAGKGLYSKKFNFIFIVIHRQ